MAAKVRLPEEFEGALLPLHRREREEMDEETPQKTAEYQDGDVMVLSRAPLIGTLELIGDDDESIHLRLDRERTEELVSVLLEFLMQGEGEDSPRATFHSQH
jgi:hypothetical protein